MNRATSRSQPLPTTAGSVLRNSLRELRWMLGLWAVLLAWVVGYCSLVGYSDVGETPAMVLGLPAWVVWGVLAPWIVATVASSWFAIYRITDDDLNESDPDEFQQNELDHRELDEGARHDG